MFRTKVALPAGDRQCITLMYVSQMIKVSATDHHGNADWSEAVRMRLDALLILRHVAYIASS